MISFLVCLNTANCSSKANLNLDGKAIKVHDKISQYGLFTEIKSESLTSVSTGIPYDLNTPLFSDYTRKDRIIFLPDGTNMAYNSEKEFELPIGSIIAKTFSLPENFATKSGKYGKRLETRLLIHQPQGWFAVSYLWNELNTDAEIAYAGESIPVVYKDESGNKQSFNYSVPSRNQCASCHQAYEGRSQSIVPIGIKARHLNKDYSFSADKVNQLEYMESKKALVGLPSFGIPKLADASNTNESINDRARAYLDINCAHCHQASAAGGINSKLILSYNESDSSLFGVCKTPGSAGKGGGGLRFDVVPGKPLESILHYRMATTDPGAMMPQIGRALTHVEGVDLIYKWIEAMESKSCP
ncbi:SO2930 family diheme c-type cytochrome [Leptospira sp. GIMC2001]|uniref:SO2930 family diheme c-type cytochrome n=1 Tax=Leptospira sp. GIMC2001 TaxID=1513297 RepID=UPI00234B5269|nr:SO2930 family diheme c-type cytochrome [Leptospira sp. GIMC2001]WCL50217.1 hypothetical protein O4O04_05190 [Leptospira sp. GIMC2001]